MYVTAQSQELFTSDPVNAYPRFSAGATSVYGSNGNDSFNSKSGEAMYGGLGDDSYNLWQAGATVVEKAGEGVDTVYGRYWGGVVLPDNVENLFLVSAGATFGTGNSLDNIIVAGDTGARLDGKGGNDVLVGGKGDDVFIVSAGNGSDSIMDFTTGHDTILLQGYGYGISGWSDLSSHLHQKGDDVFIDLPNGEILAVRDISVSDLDAADFGMALPSQTPNGFDSLDHVWNCEAHNGWYVLNNAWGADNLTEGKDYVLTSYANPDDMTAGTTFNWAFPTNTHDTMKVLAYPEVIFGVSPHGDSPSNRVGVLPIQVSDISGFKADYDVDFQGSNGFNVAFDIWLTSKAYGDYSTITNEVMIWVHQGDFGAYGDVVGTYSKDGFNATIYHSGTYTALVADGDVPEGSIDVADILHTLADLGIVSQDEYVASVEFGAEVSGGAGSLTINNLDLKVDEIGNDGSIITHYVTGAGTDTVYSPTLPDSSGEAVTAPAPTPVMQPLTDADGHITGYTQVEDRGSRGVFTSHFDADKNLIDSKLVQDQAGGAVRTTHYNASDIVTGSELDVPKGGTSHQTYYYDADGTLTGSTLFSDDPSGDSRAVFYDANGAFSGADLTSIRSGLTYVTHYDAHWSPVGRTIEGTDGADKLYGGTSANVLIGGAGDDSLVGNVADDVLTGGAGRDLLRGMGGADRFVFERASDIGTSRATADVILDFSAAQGDRIDLSAIDADITKAGHQSFTFTDHQPTTPTAGSLWLENGIQSGVWELKGDVDGDGKADFDIEVHAASASDINADTILGAERPAGPHDVTTTLADGSVRTTHYDAKGVVTGSDLEVTQGNGARTYHYDSDGTLLDSEYSDVDGAGNDRVIHYDANGKMLGMDTVAIRNDGVRIETHFDTDWKPSARLNIGTDDDDVIYGGTGSNTLVGGAGNDRLGGNSGNDRLIGGAGQDVLKGFAGADTFVFEKASDTGNTHASADWILDFNRADGDKIDLSAIDANSAVSGHQSFTFTDHEPATPIAGSLWLEGSGRSWYLSGDLDGDGKADFTIHVDTVHSNGIGAGDLIL